MAVLSFSPLSQRSLSSYVLVLVLCLSSSILVTSKPLDTTTLDDLFALVQASGSEGSAEVVTSPLRDQRDVSGEADPTHAVERGAESGHKWPRLLLDIMAHQSRFRGRTKKNIGRFCTGNDPEPVRARRGGRC